MMTNPTYRKIGAHLNQNGTCDFVVWAPAVESIQLKITAPQIQTHVMVRDEWGYWTAQVAQVKVGTRYVFVIDGAKERPDPASASQPEGVHGASEVIDRNYSWNDSDWKGKALQELIIYELHVGTFTKEGTLEAVIGKLAYLKDLGVNAIELMPVGAFPGDRNWGYDVAYPYAVQQSYGGASALKSLVNAAHREGIAVILDVIYNHVGPDGNYFKDYAPYFTDKYKTPWGEALNYDGAECDGVRNYLIQNALMWLDEFNIDGLRMDAVHAIWDYSAHHVLEDLKGHVSRLEEASGKKKVLIAEFDLNNPRYITSPEKGGYGLDGQWVDEFHHALHSMLTGETDGYYEDFGQIQHLERAFKNTYVYDGVYSKHRKKMFGTPLKGHDYGQFVVFSQNHDHIGNRPLGDRLTQTLSFEQLKLAAAAVLLSPYVPMLFMGEEYMEQNPFLFFVHHQDPELVKVVSQGRKDEFSYFNFKDEFPDPQSEEVFLKSKLSWNQDSDEKSALMFSFYKHLIALRKTHPCMQLYDRGSVKVHPASGDVLVFERSCESGDLVIALNFSKHKASIPTHVCSNCTKIFDSSDIEWGGPELVWFGTLNICEDSFLNPLSATVFELKASDRIL